MFRILASALLTSDGRTENERPLMISVRRRTSARQADRALAILLGSLGAALLVCLTVLLYLILQTSTDGTDSLDLSFEMKTGNNQQGAVQLVVGHYAGNLAAERRANLTNEQLNANNYAPIAGWGENGRAVYLDTKSDIESDLTYGINQFNLFVSDRIAANRSLPDIRPTSCRHGSPHTNATLPTTSVIIVFHNEAFSTLLRTVTSVVNRSPRHLLREVILVDDYSNRTFLRDQLDEAMRRQAVSIKILRASERVGLIRARLIGAREATGEVLTFLDSHCECTPGWLEPLLERVQNDSRTVACPVIDVINERTFAYQRGIAAFRGAFNWALQFRWYSTPNRLRPQDSSRPLAYSFSHELRCEKVFRSPTMAGGLFSISRAYFQYLGTYDEHMSIWGGENIEMSFRIWQCGGRIEIVPCSHVGHVFRHSSPHDFPGKGSGKILNANLVRAAEVWMDEWKHFFYRTSKEAERMRDSVDVSQRVELRRRLKCRSFRWYLDNVWPDHHLPVENVFFGRISNGARCLVARPGDERRPSLTSSRCSLAFDPWQMWLFDRERSLLRADEHQCLSAVEDVLSGKGVWKVQLKECAELDAEKWTFVQTRGWIKHLNSGLCLTLNDPDDVLDDDAELANPKLRPPKLSACQSGRPAQRWTFHVYDWRRRSANNATDTDQHHHHRA